MVTKRSYLTAFNILLFLIFISPPFLGCEERSSNDDESENERTVRECIPDCTQRCLGDDGCGSECPADNCEYTGQTCGMDGTCQDECTPLICGQEGTMCGSPNDGCGGTLNCGLCANGQECSATFSCNDDNMCELGYVLNDAGECVERDFDCIKLTERRVSIYPPAGVRVSFAVTDCEDQPIRRLTSEEVVIINESTGEVFGAGGEGGGASAPTNPSSYGLFSVLMLDMSGSIFERNAQGAVFDAAEAFVNSVVINASDNLKHKVAIQVFGRSGDTEIVVPFTDDGNQLLDIISILRDQQQSLGSTNLYGAYREAIDVVSSVGDDLELVERSLVVFTDGVHEAGDLENQRELALEALSNAQSMDKLTAFSVYLGETDDAEAINAIKELASAEQNFRIASGSDLSSLTNTFEDIGITLDGIAKSNYVVGICTPVELGTGELSIQVNANGVSSSIMSTYDTSNLTGDVQEDSCNPDQLAEPCKTRECGRGFISGFQCGECGFNTGAAGSQCVSNDDQGTSCECNFGETVCNGICDIDSDNDGSADSCDDDDDNDGVLDDLDNCHFVSNESQLDNDGDQYGDECDDDDDNDGIQDDFDNCPFISNSDQLNFDDDDLGNQCDDDDDNDGITDDIDNPLGRPTTTPMGLLNCLELNFCINDCSGDTSCEDQCVSDSSLQGFNRLSNLNQCEDNTELCNIEAFNCVEGLDVPNDIQYEDESVASLGSLCLCLDSCSGYTEGPLPAEFINGDWTFDGINWTSASIGNNQSTSMYADLSANVDLRISFEYKVSSEGCCDRFSFSANGNQLLNEGGEIDWTTYTFEVPVGSLNLEWRYSKDSSDFRGSDFVQIRNITVLTGDPPVNDNLATCAENCIEQSSSTSLSEYIETYTCNSEDIDCVTLFFECNEYTDLSEPNGNLSCSEFDSCLSWIVLMVPQKNWTL